jgi:hypothetical protein
MQRTRFEGQDSVPRQKVGDQWLTETRSFLTRPGFSRVVSVASKRDLEKFKGFGTTGAFGGDEQSVQMVREKAGRSIRRTQVALGRETPVVRALSHEFRT